VKVEYRFLRYHEGRPSIARVTVEAEPSDKWSVNLNNIVLNDGEHRYTGYWDIALKEGSDIAIHEHKQRGGGAYQIEIVKLIDFPLILAQML
jgi:hypothetical protein